MIPVHPSYTSLVQAYQLQPAQIHPQPLFILTPNLPLQGLPPTVPHYIPPVGPSVPVHVPSAVPAVPVGSVPVGSVPMGNVPMGNVPAVPTAPVPPVIMPTSNTPPGSVTTVPGIPSSLPSVVLPAPTPPSTRTVTAHTFRSPRNMPELPNLFTLNQDHNQNHLQIGRKSVGINQSGSSRITPSCPTKPVLGGATTHNHIHNIHPLQSVHTVRTVNTVNTAQPNLPTNVTNSMNAINGINGMNGMGSNPMTPPMFLLAVPSKSQQTSTPRKEQHLTFPLSTNRSAVSNSDGGHGTHRSTHGSNVQIANIPKFPILSTSRGTPSRSERNDFNAVHPVHTGIGTNVINKMNSNHSRTASSGRASSVRGSTASFQPIPLQIPSIPPIQSIPSIPSIAVPQWAQLPPLPPTVPPMITPVSSSHSSSVSTGSDSPRSTPPNVPNMNSSASSQVDGTCIASTGSSPIKLNGDTISTDPVVPPLVSQDDIHVQKRMRSSRRRRSSTSKLNSSSSPERQSSYRCEVCSKS